MAEDQNLKGNPVDEMDPFAQAFAEQDRRKRDEELAKLSGGGNFNFEKIKYLGLKKDQYVPFRIIGLPWEVRKNPTDCKLVLQSKILKDDGSGYIKVNWKHEEKKGKIVPASDFFLTKVYNAVFESKWVKYTEADIGKADRYGKTVFKNNDGKIVNSKGHDGAYFYIHQNKACYKRMDDNTKQGDQIKKRFYPSARVVMNVVASGLPNEDNKAWVLTSSLNEVVPKNSAPGTAPITFVETGISKTMYDDILLHVREFRKDWNLDIAIKKYEVNNTYSHEIKDATDSHKLPDYLKSIMSVNPIDISKLELWDLDKVYGDSKMTKIKKGIGGLIKQIDIELGRDFSSELDYLVQKENEELQKMKEAEGTSSATSYYEEADEPSDSHSYEAAPSNDPYRSIPEVDTSASIPEAPAPEAPPARRERAVMDAPVPKDTLLKNYFPNYDSCDELDKQSLISWVADIKPGQAPVWNEGVTLSRCDDSNCKFPGTSVTTALPNNVLHCPVCGITFK